MRFKSRLTNGYKVYAITGTNTVSFAIDFEEANTKGLLGFSVQRYDPTEDEKYFIYGKKVFRDTEIVDPDQPVSSYEFPIQSFVWDDFTAKDGRDYTYYFYPVKGKPKNLVHESPIKIEVKTEPLFSKNTHDIFFNRGVASSQAYAVRFDNKAPNKLEGAKKKEAEEWLSRSLDEAIIKFIDQAKNGDQLYGCFYEFRFLPVLKAFKAAIDRGVDVKIIIDAKKNEHTDKKGVFHESFPREDNLRTIKKAKIPTGNIIKREASKNNIQHNKFIIYSKAGEPKSVWTGSTNISEGGIFGQTNVGHWLRDKTIATNYLSYWHLLSNDLGMQEGDSTAKRRKDNKAFKKQVMAIQEDISLEGIVNGNHGVKAVFSPRIGKKMLNTYAAIIDNAKESAFITLAFGISKVFKSLLVDNDKLSHIVFMLLEKKDKKHPRSKDVFIKLGPWNNIYQAYGNFIRTPLYNWTKEINTRVLKINFHVSYVHSKFLMMDPLSNDAVIITGSANFSEPSTTSNDENMLIIKGNKRVADIYFTEFNRLFNHYYFRAVIEELKEKGMFDPNQGIFMTPDDTWLDKYTVGKLRYKRVKMFVDMDL